MFRFRPDKHANAHHNTSICASDGDKPSPTAISLISGIIVATNGMLSIVAEAIPDTHKIRMDA